MDDKINDGGPAFPADDTGTCSFRPGMSLRDYFAGEALRGMLAGTPGTHLRFDNAARESYEYADAMLKARAA